MESALKVNIFCIFVVLYNVSILLLMESALKESCEGKGKEKACVSILLLMESALKACKSFNLISTEL